MFLVWLGVDGGICDNRGCKNKVYAYDWLCLEHLTAPLVVRTSHCGRHRPAVQTRIKTRKHRLIRSLPWAPSDSSLVRGISFHPASAPRPVWSKREPRVFDGGLPSSSSSPSASAETSPLWCPSLLHSLPPVIHLSFIFFSFLSFQRKYSVQMEMVEMHKKKSLRWPEA